MANNVTTDATCVALYKLESGALTTDSKSTNTLTNSGVIASATHVEGSYSGRVNSGKYLYISDANLAAGFPFKFGDTNLQMSIAYWFYPTVLDDGWVYHIGKLTNWGGLSFLIETVYDGSIRARVKDDSSYTYIYSGYWIDESTWYQFTLTPNTWHHLGLSVDNSAKLLLLRLYNAYTGIAETFTQSFEGNLVTTNDPLYIGNSYSYQTTYFDEIFFFNTAKTASQFDLIRLGLYDGTSRIYSIADPFNLTISTSTIEFNSGVHTILVPPPSTPRYPNWRDTKGDGPWQFTPHGDDACTDPLFTAETRYVDPTVKTTVKGPHFPCGHWHHNYLQGERTWQVQ